MTLLIWLHVAAMFSAFALFVGTGTAIRAIAPRADAQIMRVIVGATEPLFRAGGIAVAIGFVAGLVLAHNFGYASPWLVAAYVLSAFAALLGIGIDAPWARRMAASDDSTLKAVRRERLPAIAGWLGGATWLTILWLMIAKP